jgi:hypothetical protein
VLCVEIADRVDMFLLERNEVDRLSSDELVETIDQKCLWSPEAKNLVKAEILATRIDEIATQSARLFGGLALA